MVLCTVLCYIMAVIATSLSFQELCSLAISGSCYLCGLMVTAYQFSFRKQFKPITDGIDSIAKKIFESDLSGKEFLQDQFQKNSKTMSVLTNVSLVMSFITPCSYCLSMPLGDWLSGNYRSRLPFPIVTFFNNELSVVYESVLLLLYCSLSICTAKKFVNDCLFISLFKMQTDFLKYLSVSKKAIRKELLLGDDCQEKLLAWIKLQQEIIKNIEDLILTFSPVVIIYYITVIVIVACGAFVQLKKEDDSIVQSMSVGSYLFITVLYHFLLSNTAHGLSSEAEKLIFVEYSLPWYEMEKKSAKMVQLVMAMCNKPIKVTAYKAPTFLLNRETFAGFMVTATSAFVTFCQMEDIYG